MTRMNCHITESNEYQSLWVIPESCSAGGTDNRLDLANLRISNFSRSICGVVYIDIGLPVLQSYHLNICQNIDSECFKSYENRTLLVKILGFLAISLAANRPLIHEKLEKQSLNIAAPNAFQNFFPELGDTFNNSNFPENDCDQNSISLPMDIVNFGISRDIICETDVEVQINQENRSLTIGKARSSLQVVSEMLDLSSLLRIQFNPDFSHIDLNKASQALKVVSVPNASSVWHYGNTYNPHHKFRFQAACSYPLFAELMVTSETIKRAIDQGQPLRPHISNLTGLSAGKLKRLACIAPSGLSNSTSELLDDASALERHSDLNQSQDMLRLDDFLGPLRNLDVGWFPKCQASWKYYCDILSACIIPLANRYDIEPTLWLNEAKGKWKEYHDKLADRSMTPSEHLDRRALQLMTEEVFAAVDDFTYSILLPTLLQSIQEDGQNLPFPTTNDLISACSTSVYLLNGGNSCRASVLFRIARRWQNRIPALCNVVNQSRDGKKLNDQKYIRTLKEWPRLTEDYTASNGLVVRNLYSTKQLKEESNRLSHCVGNLYLTHAKYGNCHLFSVQDKSGENSFSTFEISPPLTDNQDIAILQLRLVQHKARNNQLPATKERAAYTEWKDAISKGNLTINLNEVVEWKERIAKINASNNPEYSQISPKEAWSRILNISWNDETTRQMIWNEWNSYILSQSTQEFTESSDLLNELCVSDLRKKLQLI